MQVVRQENVITNYLTNLFYFSYRFHSTQLNLLKNFLDKERFYVL
jgi:hypothetical protein